MNGTIRRILTERGKLKLDPVTLSQRDDLYDAGLSSFAAVQVMLGLEEAFRVEFPEEMMNRATFASIASIEAAISTLAPRSAA